MADGWIFQANPDHYDIDGALAQLSEVAWRAPQYASQIAVNDPVVIWRSGKQAGVIGLGRVLTSPSRMEKEPAEHEFLLADQGSEATTRVRLAVTPVDLVSKATVAAEPELAQHQIVTAPMGTVFPLEGSELAGLLAFMSDELPAETRSPLQDIPKPLGWDQRYKSVVPIPGGVENYTNTLAQVLTHVNEQQPTEENLNRWMGEVFDVSPTRQRNTTGFLQRVSLIRSSSAMVELTAEGGRWLDTRDDLYLLALIHSRTRYVGEMLAAIAEGVRTPKDLLEHANRYFAAGWTTRAQIDRRRHILSGTGAIRASDDGLFSLTDSVGRQALDTLELQPPMSPVETVSKQPEPTTKSPPPKPDSRGGGRLEELIAQLETTAHESDNPDALEQAVRDAFAFLGFEARWLGGSGKTDVLLAAELGPSEQYRVIVDTKSTSHAAVSDQQIDWMTLTEHRDKHGADHVCLVAPAFQGGRLEERAAKHDVGLIEIPGLVSLLEQHAQAPLGLAEYRRIFEDPRGLEEVAESADSFRRGLDLAARVIHLLDELQGAEGALQARDLYWNLKADEDAEFDPPTKEELEDILQALAMSPLQLLRQTEDGYLSLGSRDTTRHRLEVLASLL